MEATIACMDKSGQRKATRVPHREGKIPFAIGDLPARSQLIVFMSFFL
jgi:hypothetical protein